MYIKSLSSVEDLDPYVFGSVADPGSGIRCLFDPWIRDSGWVKIRIRDDQKQFFGLKYLKFFDADPGWKQFGSEIRDGKKSDPGKTSRIRNTGFGPPRSGYGSVSQRYGTIRIRIFLTSSKNNKKNLLPTVLSLCDFFMTFYLKK